MRMNGMIWGESESEKKKCCVEEKKMCWRKKNSGREQEVEGAVERERVRQSVRK